MLDIKILNIPGYGGSGKDHWQTFWDKEFENIKRVEQQDWDNPQLDLWVETLNQSIQKQEKNIILVAHSLACSLVAHWDSRYQAKNVIGALLVSPADVDSDQHTPQEVRNFSPMPTNSLSFKSIVVASDNDTYVSLERAEYFAKLWGSHFVNYGSYGHINGESTLSSWEDGKKFIQKLL